MTTRMQKQKMRDEGLTLMLANVSAANDEMNPHAAIRAGLSVGMTIAVELHSIANSLESNLSLRKRVH